MFKKLSKVTLLIVLAFASFCTIADSKHEQRLFFENPSIVELNKFVDSVSAKQLISDLKKDKIVIFLSEAFKANPSLCKEVISRFTSYDLATQELLYSALVSSKIDLPPQFKDKHKNIKIRRVNEIVTINFIQPYSTKSDMLNNMDIVDLHWAAYYASGNPLFLKKILKFSSNHLELVKDISRDFTNREYLNELTRSLGTSEKIANNDLIKVAKEQGITYQVMGHHTVSWSIRSNASKYKIVSKTAEKLFNEDPSLDF